MTSTVSVSPPTSSVTGTEWIVAASTVMPLRTSFLNPSSSNDDLVGASRQRRDAPVTLSRR